MRRRSTTTPTTTWRCCGSTRRSRPSNRPRRRSAATAGAVLGYPENGPYAVAPARFGETRTVISEDSYGNGPIHRSIAFLRGSVRSGNSGGPLVDSRGRVIGTVFAATTAGPPGGFADPRRTRRSALTETPAPRRHGSLHRLRRLTTNFPTVKTLPA